MAELKRVFTARTVALLTVGGVIGSGIFLVPGRVLEASGGTIGMATMVWILGGLLSFVGALSYAELAAANPTAGGLYVYLRDAFGSAVAFAYGWTLFVVIASGTVAALAVASATYIAGLIPMGSSAQQVLAVALALLITAINTMGTSRSATIFSIGTALKIGAIVVLVVALPLLGNGFAQVDQIWPATFDASLLTAAGLAVIAVLWAYEGWQYVTFVAGETIDPQRNFPRGLALGTLALVLIYVAAVLAYTAALGPADMMASSRVAIDATNRVLGPTAGTLIAVPIIISMLTAAQANSLTSSRVYFAMANDGIFFKQMAKVHPRWGTPAVALVAAGVWSAILAASGTFDVLLEYVVFVGWIFYSLVGLAVLVLRRKQPDLPRPFKVPGYPVTPLLFVIAGFAIVVNTVVQDPRKGLIGIGATLLAFPVYYFWRRQTPSSPSPRGVSDV